MRRGTNVNGFSKNTFVNENVQTPERPKVTLHTFSVIVTGQLELVVTQMRKSSIRPVFGTTHF